VQRNGTSLVFSGVLDRAAVTALWPSLTALDGVQQLDGFTDLSAAYRLAPTLDFHALSAAS